MSQFVYNVETGEVTELPDAIENPSANNDLAWFNLRMERNALLAACDWTVLADTPTSTAAWKAYRQQLRDLPANTTDPHNVVWPTPPA
jgi:hypothetical protein